MIYFDTAATTKVSEEVIADIVESLRNDWANPSSTYAEGLEVKRKIERAKKQIADYINADPEEVIFTSSGSEANNLAIKGFIESNPNFDCILTTKAEHPSVYNVCEWYRGDWYNKVVYCPVNFEGCVSIKRFHPIISLLSDRHFCFVSIMMANNELGSINPIKELVKDTHVHQGIFHTDATQAFGKIPIDVKDLDVDLMSVSLHKVGLPKGIGFLYKKKEITLDPLIRGGHQEMDVRAGTENTAYIIAAGKHIDRLSKKGYQSDEIRHYLMNKIHTVMDYDEFPIINGSYPYGLPNILSLTFRGINAEALITLLDMRDICVSAGSACCSGEKEPSRVLKAIGMNDEDAFSTVRISIDENTTKEECDEFIKILGECLNSLQMMQ